MIRRYFFGDQRNCVLVTFFVLLLLAFCTFDVHAQTSGTIYGRVGDRDGAAITGATVTVTNAERNLKRTATTDAAGLYTFTVLPVGRYSVAAEAAGFKLVLSETELQVEQHLRMDFRMEIGEITERVLVTTESPQIDTAGSTLGKVVEQKRIVELPLNGRNFLQLGLLQAGVAPPVAGIDVIGSGTNRTPGGTGVNFSVNGQRVTSNNHLLDGVNNVEPVSGSAMIVPSADALQEFRILTNSYSAEFGRAGGSIVTVLTKNGTNNFHGSAYEFLRNDIFDARNFFAPDVPALRQNQFGATIGGPILLPRFGEGGSPIFYDGRNSTFFFFSYEGFRQIQGRPTSTTVPSLRTRQGDFSQEAVKPIDPLTGQPFPGAIIPQDRINPVSRNVLGLWPEPNAGSNIWSGAPTDSHTRDQFLVRIDHSFLAGKNTLTARYVIDEGDVFIANRVQSTQGTFVDVPEFGVEDSNRFQNLTIADTHLISPEIISESRLSYARARVDSGKFANPQDPRRLGFTYPMGTSSLGDPAIAVSGFSSVGYNLFNGRVNNIYEFVQNFSINTGKHSFKVGGNVRHSRVFSLFPSIDRGSFIFNGGVTGNSMADLLLGRPFLFLQAGGRADKTLRQTAYYVYGQDDFRVSRNLTLNLGLRYELVPGFTERDNLLMTFKAGERSVLSPTHPVGILRSGDPGIPETLFPTGKLNFAPRVGLAWDPFGTGKTSIRAAYGIFYDESALVQTFMVQQPPAFQSFASVILAQSFADPFLGNSPFTPPLRFPLRFPVGSVTWIAPDLKLAYIQHWNLTVQRQLTSAMAVEVAYVGNKGTDLQGTMDPNQAVWNPGATRANINARRPFAGIGNVIQISPIFNSNYHGLQTTLTHRLSRGLSFQSAYTWSKAIDDTTIPSAFFLVPGQATRPQNSFNLQAERALSAFDIRHRFVTSYLYELPFFRQGTGSFLLGGWKLSGIATFQSGTPFTVIDTSNPKLDADISDRPDLLRDPRLPNDQRTAARWFDTTAFRRLVMPNYGNAGRNILHTDRIINFDMGLAKDFALGEQTGLEFRWEVFNVFNHTNFGVPVNDFNSSNFGRVLRTSTSERVMQFGLKFLF